MAAKRPTKKAVEDIADRLYTIIQNGEKVLDPDRVNEFIDVMHIQFEQGGTNIEQFLEYQKVVVFSFTKSGMKTVFERKIGVKDTIIPTSDFHASVVNKTWNTNELIDILNQYIEQMGAEVFYDRKKSCALCNDILSYYPDELKILRVAFSEGLGEVLSNCRYETENERNRAQHSIWTFLSGLGISDAVKENVVITLMKTFGKKEIKKQFELVRKNGEIAFIADSNTTDKKPKLYTINAEKKEGTGLFHRFGIERFVEAMNESTDGYRYVKENSNRLVIEAFDNFDYFLTYKGFDSSSLTKKVALATIIAICAVCLDKKMQDSFVIIGDMSEEYAISDVNSFKDSVVEASKHGFKNILVSIMEARYVADIPEEVISKVSFVFYSTPEDAVCKALGIK